VLRSRVPVFARSVAVLPTGTIKNMTVFFSLDAHLRQKKKILQKIHISQDF